MMRSCLIITGLIAANLGCRSTDVGKPLITFEATNGNYFPSFVFDLFEGAQQFQTDYGSLAEAKSRIRLIQVKPLTRENSPINEANLSWSADGAHLSYEITEGMQRRIMVKNLVNGRLKKLAMLPGNSGKEIFASYMDKSLTSFNSNLSWATDSTRFAFMSNGGTGDYNIYIGAIGAPEAPVAKSESKDGFAKWSPNSDEIVFVSARTGGGDIYLLNLEDKSLQNLTGNNEIDIFPTWTPQGDTIVYSSGTASRHRIMQLSRLDGEWRKPALLTDWNRDSLKPILSPDGRSIAFYGAAKAGNSWNIYVIPFHREKTYNESELEGMLVAEDVIVDLNTGPAWTPDSRKIFYVKQDTKNFNPIYGYDLFSGKQYVLRTGTKMNRDLMMSKVGILSFRAQVGAWDKVFLALTNQGLQLQPYSEPLGKILYQKQTR
jgi:Tol biopolymer transport system component